MPTPGEIYNTAVADAGLVEGNELATIGEGEANLRSNVGNAENTITSAEPRTYNAEVKTAAKGGLLNSGINSQRKTTIANNFAQKRTANQARLTQGLNTYKRSREGAGLKKTLTEHNALGKRTAEEEAWNATHPVAAAVPQAAAAPVPNAPTRLPNEGIVRPYMEPHTYGGTPNWSRDPAVRARQVKEYNAARGR
jgi:hypothetical protein